MAACERPEASHRPPANGSALTLEQVEADKLPALQIRNQPAREKLAERGRCGMQLAGVVAEVGASAGE